MKLRIRAALLALAAVVSLAACATGASPSPTVASPVDGVVTAVDSAGLGNVKGFTLRVPGGATIKMTLGTLENPTQFAPGHLAEHEATGSPIRVYFVRDADALMVYRLEDAPAPART